MVSCDPTNHAFTICRHASRLLKQMWLKEYRYAKAGVMLNDVAPHKQQISTACAKPAHETLLAALNGIKQDWKPRSAMFLARYTARLEKIMMAQCY
ncbi:MAG: hypothetical protein ABF468_00965 [Acetobacter fabarum]|uniref:DinB/UmuC family translesion DNA polymerase n=1 Tax=Acetobacter fabarum TaxID=483199 RepID=UPI00314510B8